MKVRDPVCGRDIDLAAAAAAEDHAGWAYFFCSERCRKRFMESPRGFAAMPSAPKGGAPAGRPVERRPE